MRQAIIFQNDCLLYVFKYPVKPAGDPPGKPHIVIKEIGLHLTVPINTID